MKIWYSIILICAFTFISNAHEEPSKTLNEKSNKEKSRNRIFKSKIKKILVWKYTVNNGKETDKKNKIFVQEYDQNGNFIAIEAYKNDSLTEREEYTFNSLGDMLTDIDLSSDRKLIEKNTFKYDKEGRVISGESFNKKNILIEYFNIIKSKDKKNIEFIKHKVPDSLDYKLIYKYSADFDKNDYIEAEKYDSKGNLIMKVEKRYDSSGQATEKIIYGKDKNYNYKFIYEYDNLGNNTKVTKMNADSSIEWIDYYSYDLNGICLEIRSYDSKNILKTYITYSFEYYN